MSVITGFDRFLNEHRAKKVVEKRSIKIGEREYEIAPVLPASLVLSVQRLQKEYGTDENVPPEMIITMADSIFGPGQIERIAAENGLDMEELGELFRMTMESYTNTGEEEGSTDEVLDPTPAKPELISSKNGT